MDLQKYNNTSRLIEFRKTLEVSVDNHFRDLTKMIALTNGSQREVLHAS